MRPTQSSTALRRVTSEQRTLAISYLLWCLTFVGICGVHRLYNRKPVSGIFWLLTFGLCGLGQLVDLLLMPSMVQQANQLLLLEQTLSAMPSSVPASIERQLLQLARRAGPEGFTINDAMLELNLPQSIDSDIVTAEIERLLHASLLDVGNDAKGRVIYTEP